MTDHERYVLTPAVPFVRDVRGTPWVDSIDEHTKRGRPKRVRYSRASGYAEQVRSTFTLQQRDRRMLVLGAAALVDELLPLNALDVDDPTGMEMVDAAVAACFAAAGWSYAADRGNVVHSVLEYADRGWPLSDELVERCDYFAIDHQQLTFNWQAFLDDHGFVVLAVEFPGVADHYRVAGSLDRIVLCTRRLVFGRYVIEAGTVIILDLKSGRLWLTADGPSYWSGYTGQLALYAAMDPYFVGPPDRRGRWPWGIDQTSALIAHVDVEHGCRLAAWHVDLAAGRELCELAAAARRFEARNDLFVAGPA